MTKTRTCSRATAAAWTYKISLLTTLSLLFVGTRAAADDAVELSGARPNIVVIMPDDMGWGDLAAHGNPLIHTPTLDRLHSESLRFTDFHVSPTCAPTRAAILGGRHEFLSGVTHTVFERERLSLDTVTLPQTLKRAGYSTGIFGKWHLGDEKAYQPLQRGFDEAYIHGGGGIGQSYPGSCGDLPDNHYFNPTLLHNSEIVKTEGYCTDQFFDQAIRWIDEQRRSHAPFFAYITPNTPHSPLVSPGPEYDKRYRDKKIDGKALGDQDVAYYSMITNIDENVDRLLRAIKEWGLESNTLVVFLSDNGGTHVHLYSGGFRGRKGTVYHGGTHAPSFWRWPGKIPEGVDVAALSAHVDLYPTLAQIAGAELSEEASKQIKGRSLVPLLDDPAAPWDDRYLVTHWGRWNTGEVEGARFSNCSIRNTRFRLVNNNELYDLRSDPGEKDNVIDQHPETVRELRAEYDRWWAEALPRTAINERAKGPKVNPFKQMYWDRFGGGPTPELLKRMNPEEKFRGGRP